VGILDIACRVVNSKAWQQLENLAAPTELYDLAREIPGAHTVEAIAWKDVKAYEKALRKHGIKFWESSKKHSSDVKYICRY